MIKNSIVFILLVAMGASVFATDVVQKNAAELYILVSAEGKKELIQSGYVKESAFSHSNPNVLVIKEDTALDISFVQGIEDVKAQCFMGTPAEAKPIVEKLIVNADGNGDSWLDKMEVSSTERKVTAKYSLITEAEYPQNHEFEVESCEAPKKPIVKDPVIGKYDMCGEEIVKLPEHVYTELKQISESKGKTAVKLNKVKALFKGIAFSKAMDNYCGVVAQVMDTTIVRCREAMQDPGLSNPQILQMTKSNASQDEVTCSLSAMIALMIRPF